MRRLFVVGAALFALGLASSGRAVVLLSDFFNYPDGSLVTVSDGAWSTHSGTTAQVQVSSGKAFISQANSEDVSVLLPGEPYSPSTNVVLYSSFTVNFTALPSGNGNYFAHFKDSGTGFHPKVFATTNGAAPGTFRVGLANLANAPDAVLASNLNLNTDYTLVIRYVLSDPANSTLWLNPQAETDPSVTATDSASPINVAAFALRESLGSGNGMGSLYVDNLRVGTSFSDVVPNAPATPPSILSQPQNLTVTEGSNATFGVVADGTAPLCYQWQFYVSIPSTATNLPGATNDTLTLTTVSSNQAGYYFVAITNAAGSTNSQAACLLVEPAPIPPGITAQPQSQTVSEGADVSLSVSASGTAPLCYQWQFYATNLPGATNSTIELAGVTAGQAGPYTVTVSNLAGSTNSEPALLTVNTLAPPPLPALSVLTYNVAGNGASDWSTNAEQVQAIGRQLMYLQPDIITFNEIPYSYTWQMTNFVAAFLPGYWLATNSGTDGFIRSVVASRYPILFSKSWLDNSSLAQFGYNGRFTRDLFQAQIAVPGFVQPLDVFVTHLKATTSSPQDNADKRAAEAGAISNFFVTVFLPGTNGSHPYLLSGDLNEDVFRPDTNKYTSGQPIQRLVSATTGLQLTTPLNPITHTDLTESIQKTLNVRFDYILPCGLLFSNILSSQVFRTDLLTNPPPPPPLLADDDITASDHLPVLMFFRNPYSFRLLALTVTNQTATLQWESVSNQVYGVKASSNLTDWTTLSDNLVATGASCFFRAAASNPATFFRVYRAQ